MNDYKNETSSMRWSFSRVTTYDQCPYEWYLHYIVNDNDLYPEEENYYAQVGKYVHNVLEKVFKAELSVDDAFDYYVDHFDENVTERTSYSSMDKTFDACADYFLDINNIKHLTDGMDIVGVEKKIEFEIEGKKFIGYIDLLLKDRKDGKLIVLDHKSSEYPFKHDGGVKANAKSFSKYKKQLYLYSLWVKENYGEFPKLLAWNHFKDGGKLATIPFSIDEYNESIEWFKSEVSAIMADDEFNANKEFFYCNNLCSFRNCCEYKEEEE